MMQVPFSVLRGICQMPAYAARDKGFFRDEGLDVRLNVEPTAWMVPRRLAAGDILFAVIPWTRVAAEPDEDRTLVLVAGSGIEEAAIVVRKGIALSDVKRVAVPRRGGIKDLTAMGLMESLGWTDVDCLRLPSGDGAILSLVGGGADAASMVEPYATMMERLGIGTIVKRTGDVWPGAPGCSLTTTARLIQTDPGLVEKTVRAFVRGAAFVRDNPDESSGIAERYTGIGAGHIRAALDANRPDVGALRNGEAMAGILDLMRRLGYIKDVPVRHLDLSFMDGIASGSDG